MKDKTIKAFFALIFAMVSLPLFSQNADTVEVCDHYCESANPHEIDTTYFWYKTDTLFIRNIQKRFCGPAELKASVFDENDTLKIIVFNPSDVDCLADCSFGYTIKLKTGVFDSLIIKIFDESFTVRYAQIQTKLENISEEESILYPNPVSDYLTVSLNAIEEIIVTDLSGKTVLRQVGNSNQINVAQLQKGVYVIQVKYDDKIFTRKIIKN